MVSESKVVRVLTLATFFFAFFRVVGRRQGEPIKRRLNVCSCSGSTALYDVLFDSSFVLSKRWS